MADNATRLKILASVEGIQGFDGLKRSLQGLAQQGMGASRDLIKLRAAYEGLRSSGDQSIAGMRAQVQVLTQLREAVNTNSIAYRRYGTELDQVRAKLDAVTKAEKNVSNQQGIMASLATGAGVRGALTMQAGEAAMAGRLALAGGITAGLAAGAGAAAVVGGSISTAMDLAAEQRKISTLTGDTAKLNQSIADLTRAQGYMTSQAEATSAAYEILSSGFSKTSDVIQILKASTQGAVGGFSDIRTVADATTSILNGYGRSAADAQKVVDMMIQTQNDGKIVVGEYAQSIGRLVPTGAAANISLEELNAGISALTAQGVPVESTFSGLNQAIKSIIKPTDEARRMAAALGLDFSASALAAKGLGGFLADVTAKTKGNSAAMGILFSDIDGYKAVVSLTNDNLQRFNQFSKNQEQAIRVSAKAAEKAVDPFKQFSNANKDLGNSLGQVLLPPLTSVTKKVTELVRVIMGQGVPDRMKELLSLSSGFGMQAAPSLLGAFGPAAAIGKAGSALMDEFAPPPPPPPDGRRDLPTPNKLGSILPPQKTEDPKITELAGQVLGGGSNKPTKASLGAQIAKELQQALGLSEAQASGIVGNLIRESGLNPRINEGGAVGLPRNVGGYGLAQWTGTRQTDLIRFAGGASRAGDLATQLRFMVSELMGPESRAFSRLKQAQTPEQAAEIFDRFYERSRTRAIPERQANARRVFSELTNGSPVAGIGDYGRMLEKAQELAKQRLKDQQEYSTQLREDQASTKATTEELQLQRDLRTAATESDKIRAQYALDYFNTYQSLTKEIEGMVDPMSILQRIQAVDADMAERYKEGLKEIAAIENERAMQLGSQQWQDQQVTLAATLSDYYSQQSEKLQEQNELAGSLAQTIGQGMQQAFSLAIQGAENLGQSLQELGATVLKDIAQQLIQIAVIAPVIRAISGIGGGGGIAPISPGINALPAGDFSQFFSPAAGSFAAGLPTVGFTGTPLPGTGFAAGGIMTPQGPVPLRTYARGGIATAPQAAIYGEGSTPEAFIPLPDGRRVPVALKQYPGIPGASSAAQFESTDQVVQRLVETARQESTARAAAVAASSPDGTVRIKVETTRINSVDYVSVEQAKALAQAAATRSTARQQRALQSSPGARRSLGI
jgi:TP901 family phage tail tape measure protein